MTLPLVLAIAQYPPYFTQARLESQFTMFRSPCIHVNQAQLVEWGPRMSTQVRASKGGPWNAQLPPPAAVKLGWDQGMGTHVLLEVQPS